MHELSVAHAIVDTVTVALTEAEVAGDTTVVREVHVRVGDMSGVVADALQFCFDVATADSPLAGARLVVEPVPVRARCASCAVDVQPERPPIMVCPRCGGPLTGPISGRDLEISHLVLDDGAEPHREQVPA